MISLVLREGRTVCILFLLPAFILCYSRYSDAIYERIQGHRLNGYVMTAISVSDVIDCSMECLVESRCKSYNYKHKPPYTCELNNNTKANLSYVDFQANQDYSYYEICPCLNGGTCILNESNNTFRCKCKTKYQDSLCKNYIPLGSSSSNPGKSCIHIKSSEVGVTDGPQWIDPANSGTPFKAYCDMATDGGGWILVTNYIIPSSRSRPSLSVATAIPDIAKYPNKNLVISSTTLHKLRNVTSFSQLRFHCRKAVVGRTVDIITALNATGLAVVEYFTSLSRPRPDACGSFYTGPGDSSMSSKRCSEWGGSHSPGKWSIPSRKAVESKLYDYAFYTHGNYHFVIGDPSRIECDDFKQGMSYGDFWKIYVR